jgi:rRNA maturation protein Nop10
MAEYGRFCWLRLRRHRWANTGGFSFVGRGHVLRCEECGYEIACSTPEILARAKPYQQYRDEMRAVASREERHGE